MFYFFSHSHIQIFFTQSCEFFIKKKYNSLQDFVNHPEILAC
jgi:hypothetical protein